MKTIWRYTLDVQDEQFIEVPGSDAQPLSVQIQGGMPQLWVLVDPSKSKVRRKILIFGTGHHVPDDGGEYISTFQMEGGTLVFHAFWTR